MAAAPRRLVIFDLEGTLVDIEPMEREVFDAACREVLESKVKPDWESPACQTEHGRAHEAVRLDHENRDIAAPPSNQEVEALLAVYVRGLDEALGQDPQPPAEGIRELLDALQADERYACALVTGSVAGTSRRKITHFGLMSHFPVRLAAERRQDRTRLLRECLEASAHHWGTAFEEGMVVHVGDHPCDLEAARRTGIGFVGLTRDNGRARRLRDAGATVVQSLRDPLKFIRTLSD